MVLPVSKDGNTSHQKVQENQKKPKRSFKEMMNRKEAKPQASRWSVFDFPKHKQTPNLRKERPKNKTSSEHVQGRAETRADVRAVSHGAQETSAISELSPAMEELLSQMEHYLSIESQNGVSSTELTLELPDPYGQFHGTVIQIDHYDTHPHSFNVLLMSPDASAVDDLTAHLPTLLKALQTKLEHFQINLLPPAFTKYEKPESLRKINQTARGEKKGEQKTQKIERNPFLN
ncbi:hypothetical protein [Simkania sp.]|uniref:hypothetical protein n=1 Tax=Simkania sp. TaxID=34094 RepID=UPI003B518BF6